MQQLVTACPDLTDFALPCKPFYYSYNGLANDSMLLFIRSHRKLRTFIAPHCNYGSSTVAACLGECCPDLREVDLTYCQYVGNSGIVSLAAGCRKLKRLAIANTPITDIALIALGQHCPGLQMLIVKGCRRLTDAGIIALARGCRRLQHLDAERCDALTRKCVEELAKCTLYDSLAAGTSW
jgi:hypothetical protein